MNLPDRLSPLYTHMRKTLVSGGVATADRDARIIIRTHTGFDWADIVANADEKIRADQLSDIESALDRRLAGEPVSRIYGERSFWGLNFKLCDDTLDPRPDTEAIVEAALNRFKDRPPQRILDLGTGSGCILIALLSEWSGSEGIGTDKSINAIHTARQNAQINQVDGRAHFFCGSWAQALDQKFDLVVSNPPYIPNQVIPTLSQEVKNHDPILALDGGDDGLQAYKEIFLELFSLLKRDGNAFFEIGWNQENDVVRLAEESGFSVADVHHDLAGLLRVVEISCGDK